MRLLRFLRRHPAGTSITAAVLVAATVFGLYWFQPWKLWTDTTVDEAIPTVAEAAVTLSATPEPPARPRVTVPAVTDGTRSAGTLSATSTGGTPSAVAPTDEAAATSRTASPSPATPRAGGAGSTPSSAPGPGAPGATEAEPGPQSSRTVPEPEAVQLLRGELISHEHRTSGTVRVIRLADGTRVLTLENLMTSDGPDVHVWLAAAPVIPGGDGWYVFDDQPYVDLGQLKGNLGNQVYPIPADVDLDSLSSVSLWCERFSVSFGAAELN